MTDKSVFVWYGRAVYFGIGALSVVFILLASFVVQEGPLHGVLINVGSGLLTAAFVFFLVSEYFRYDPHENYWKQVELKLNDIETVLKTSIITRELKSTAEVYENASRICASFENRIQTLVFTSGPKAPKSWAETVANRLLQLRQAGLSATLDVVLVIDKEQITSNFFQTTFVERNRIYEDKGVFDALSINIIDSKPDVGFDILIVDRSHAIIAFTTREQVKTIERGILFENSPEVVGSLSDWFDALIKQRAVKYRQWIKENGFES
jgi:hypothetical protein